MHRHWFVSLGQQEHIFFRQCIRFHPNYRVHLRLCQQDAA